MLESRGITVIGHPLPDHAAISEADVRFADELEVLMTEKDAVKCRGLETGRLWYVPVDVEFEEADGRALLDRVETAIRNAGASS